MEQRGRNERIWDDREKESQGRVGEEKGGPPIDISGYATGFNNKLQQYEYN